MLGVVAHSRSTFGNIYPYRITAHMVRSNHNYGTARYVTWSRITRSSQPCTGGEGKVKRSTVGTTSWHCFSSALCSHGVSVGSRYAVGSSPRFAYLNSRPTGRCYSVVRPWTHAWPELSGQPLAPTPISGDYFNRGTETKKTTLT